MSRLSPSLLLQRADHLEYVLISPPAGLVWDADEHPCPGGQVNPSSQASCPANLTAGAGETCPSSHCPSQVGPRDLEETTEVW